MASKGKRGWIWFIAVAAIIFFLLRLGYLGNFAGFAARYSSPVSGAAGSTAGSVKDFFRSFVLIGRLSRNVRLLEGENEGLKAKLIDRDQLFAENAELREQLKLLPRQKFDIEAAQIIGRTTDGVRDSLIADKGEKDGIRPGMTVVVGEGVLLGIVEKTDRYTATLSLITDSDFKIPVKVVETGAVGLLRGARGLDVMLESIPRTTELKEGQRVATSGGQEYPEGLMVGAVKSVESSENEIFQSARIAPVANFGRANFVGIIKGF